MYFFVYFGLKSLNFLDKSMMIEMFWYSGASALIHLKLIPRLSGLTARTEDHRVSSVYPDMDSIVDPNILCHCLCQLTQLLWSEKGRSLFLF